MQSRAGADVTFTTAITTLQDSVGVGGLNTLAATIVPAINELHDSLGDAALTHLLVRSRNKRWTELGTITAGAMGTTASTVSGAIAELDSDRDDLITFVQPNISITTTATTATGASMNSTVISVQDHTRH